MAGPGGGGVPQGPAGGVAPAGPAPGVRGAGGGRPHPPTHSVDPRTGETTTRQSDVAAQVVLAQDCVDAFEVEYQQVAATSFFGAVLVLFVKHTMCSAGSKQPEQTGL